uniref:Uncharacterized protein n=1 Tax=Anguilla anguilla TaxID=7936 RepID=A0A0E9VVQ4_ANGAN
MQQIKTCSIQSKTMCMSPVLKCVDSLVLTLEELFHSEGSISCVGAQSPLQTEAQVCAEFVQHH